MSSNILRRRPGGTQGAVSFIFNIYIPGFSISPLSRNICASFRTGTHLKNRRDAIVSWFRAKTARPDPRWSLSPRKRGRGQALEYLLLLRGGTGGLQPGRWQRGENEGLAFIFSERTNGWNEVPSSGWKRQIIYF
jgi:hypothetical protein